MRNQSAATVLVVLLSAIILLSTAVFAQSSCDCGHGTVLSSTTCACQCNDGFYPPRCIFRKGEKVAVQMVVNKSVERFSGGDFERKVRVGMNLTYLDADIVFRVREPNTTTFARQHPGDYTYCQLGLTAELVQPFLDDVEAQSRPYVTEEEIILAQVVSIGAEEANSLVDTEIGTIEGARVSVNTIGWLIGCVLCILLLCILERPCYKNTYAIVQAKDEAEMAEKAKAEEERQHSEATEKKNVKANEPLYGVVIQDATTANDHPPQKIVAECVEGEQPEQMKQRGNHNTTNPYAVDTETETEVPEQQTTTAKESAPLPPPADETSAAPAATAVVDEQKEAAPCPPANEDHQNDNDDEGEEVI